MIITAMLAFYDEPVDLLSDAVTGAAVLADRIVAFDGRYRLAPGEALNSPLEQTTMIKRTAEGLGLECRVVAAREAWVGQVAKRNAMLRFACNWGADWVFPLDADWRISGNREQIRAEIEETPAEAMMVRFYQPENPDRVTREIAPHEWHIHEAGMTNWMSLIYRVYEDMRVEQNHWTYSGVRKDGVRVGFWGGEFVYQPAYNRRLESPHLFEHRCLFRDDLRLTRNRDFCVARDAEVRVNGVEA